MSSREPKLSRLRRIVVGVIAGLAFCAPAIGWSHEARPAYLEINETEPGRYDVLWRTPLLSGQPLAVALKLPDDVHSLGQANLRELKDSLLERRRIEVGGGLAGKRIEFVGLEATITDVLVRVTTRAGGQTATLVRPSQPWFDVAATAGPLAVAGAFIVHGVEHILLGYDHLLFVLALVLIVRSRGVLIATITAFTVAHSITLSLATLGVVHVPGPPVEATIALSILLLACEIVRLQRGNPSLTAQWPWVIAFSFGLLHGFGFAGVLSEIGLPAGEVPLALLSFNVGVEVGQLMFIAAVLPLLALARRPWIFAIAGRSALTVAPYAIGILAAFWFCERVAAFWA
jgi:hydrogenase/urease accessory protein HupE